MRNISWLALGAAAITLGCASGSASSSPEAPHGATAAGPVTPGGTSVLGTIQNYTQAPGGAMNGFVLASGQRVHIPESMGPQVSDKFPPNTSVQVTGHMIADPDGRPVLDADRIVAPNSNATLDLTAARAAPPGAAPPPSIGGSGTVGAPSDPPPSQTAPTSPGQQPPPR